MARKQRPLASPAVSILPMLRCLGRRILFGGRQKNDGRGSSKTSRRLCRNVFPLRLRDEAPKWTYALAAGQGCVYNPVATRRSLMHDLVKESSGHRPWQSHGWCGGAVHFIAALRHCLLAWRWLCQTTFRQCFLEEAEDLMRHCKTHASVHRAQ